MSDPHTANEAPEALMLIGIHCAHCPSVLNSLTELVKQGVLSKLEVINLEQRPEVAEQLGVCSVPWVRIGSFEFFGNRCSVMNAKGCCTGSERGGISRQYWPKVISRHCIEYIRIIKGIGDSR